jgi:hypothetical protein
MSNTHIGYALFIMVTWSHHFLYGELISPAHQDDGHRKPAANCPNAWSSKDTLEMETYRDTEIF